MTKTNGSLAGGYLPAQQALARFLAETIAPRAVGLGRGIVASADSVSRADAAVPA